MAIVCGLAGGIAGDGLAGIAAIAFPPEFPEESTDTGAGGAWVIAGKAIPIYTGAGGIAVIASALTTWRPAGGVMGNRGRVGKG